MAGAGRCRLQLGDSNFTELVLESEDSWLLMFGATCPKCQKMMPALKSVRRVPRTVLAQLPNSHGVPTQAADAIAEHQESFGVPVTKFGTVGLEESPGTYELFWIEKMPSFKLLHPQLNIMYDYVGDSENGGLCCFENDACKGDTDLFRRCLEPLHENLREFVLNVDHDKSACRSTEKDIPQKKTIWDSIILAAPRVLWKHLVKAHGLPIMLGCTSILLLMCSVAAYMALGPAPAKKKTK